MALALATYRPKRSCDSPLYGIVLDHHERFASVYDDVYAVRYGDWRPVVADTFTRFLDCGVHARGVLRVRCKACRYEVLVPWSCKKVGFCPSCAQRRCVEFGEFMDREMLEPVPYRHVVGTIPKMLRPIFLRERSLMSDLSRCLWESVRRGLAAALGTKAATPGAVTSTASLGDSANPHPHVHGMFSDGAWQGTVADSVEILGASKIQPHQVVELLRELADFTPRSMPVLLAGRLRSPGCNLTFTRCPRRRRILWRPARSRRRSRHAPRCRNLSPSRATQYASARARARPSRAFSGRLRRTLRRALRSLASARVRHISALSRLWGFLKRIPESGLHIPGLPARDTGPVQLQARDVPELHAASQPRLRGVRE